MEAGLADLLVDDLAALRVDSADHEPESRSLSELSLAKAPRRYQAELISTVLERLSLPVSHAPSCEPAARRALVYLPTGGGKTLIAAGVIFDALRRGGRCLFVVNKELLREQALHALVELGLPEASVGRIGARCRSDAPEAPVQVAMIQTLAKALPSGEAAEAEAGCGLGLDLGYGLVVLDEAHAANASTYLRLLGALPRAARLLGLTATPFRSKPCETLAQVFPPRGFVRGPPIAVLVAARHLVTPLVFAPLVRPSGAKADGSALLDAGVDMWIRRAAGARTVAFCANVAASRELAARLRDADVPAVHMDGTTPADERRRVLP